MNDTGKTHLKTGRLPDDFVHSDILKRAGASRNSAGKKNVLKENIITCL